MRDDFNAPSLINEEAQSAIQQAIDDKDSSFMHLVGVLGLSRESDFRFIDLAGVDFSGADLRGFDFTGANLRGCIGVNVRQDESTRFSGADLDHSIFAYSAERDENFDGDPALEKEYRIISGLYFLDQPGFLYDVARTTKDKKRHTAICKRLYEETTSATVQTNMLLTLGMLDNSRTSHVEFLLSICGRGKLDNRERLAIRQLADLHNDDITVFNTLMLYINSSNSMFREIALTGAMKSRHFVTALRRIRAEVFKSSTADLRRIFVSQLAGLCGPVTKICVYDFLLKRFVDYEEELDYRILVAASQRIRSLDEHSHLLEQDAEELALEKVDLLRKRLVPFVLSPRVEKEIKSMRERKAHRKAQDQALRRGIKPELASVGKR